MEIKMHRKMRRTMTGQVMVPYVRGYDYGIGVLFASGSPMGMAVSGTPTSVQGGGGGIGDFNFQQIQNSRDLEEQLGISADAGAAVGLFSASDQFAYVKACKLQTYSLALLIWCKKSFSYQQFDEPKINDTASPTVGNPTLFFQRYGDCFVRGISTGGQFFGLIRIDCKNEQTRTSVENALSGSYGPFSADVQLKLQDAINTSFATTDVHVHVEGGDIGPNLPQDTKSLLAAADLWNQSVEAKAVPYQVGLAPYIIADGPNPPSEFDFEHQREVLQRCVQLRSTQTDLINQVDFVLDPKHIDDFESFDANSLNSVRADLADDLDIITAAADYALSNANDALEPESYARQKRGRTNFPTLLPAMPKLKPGVGKPVPNITGMNWNDAETLVHSEGLVYRLLGLAGPGDGGPVYTQRPAAGVYVPPGSRVIAWVVDLFEMENSCRQDDVLGPGSTLPDDLPIPPHPLPGGGFGVLPAGSGGGTLTPRKADARHKGKRLEDGRRLKLTAVCPGSRENSVTVVSGATKFGIGNPKNTGTTCTLFIAALDGDGNVLSFPDGTSDLQLAPGESISHYYPPSGTQTIVFVCHKECEGQAVLEFDTPNAILTEGFSRRTHE